MATITQRPVRSLLHPRRSVDTPETEPLPLYTPRLHEQDPETASIASSAPTYRSEAPPYTASTPAPLISRDGPPTIGLPYQRLAPGFEMRPSGPVGDLSMHSYSIANWSTARGGPTNRQYENVARRRMQREASVTDIMQALAAVPASMVEPPTTSTSSSTSLSPGTTPSTAPVQSEPPTPYSPAEDADLVGEAAAAAARSQRLYRESCFVDPREALRGESRSWDFMMVQMRDWDERAQSWNNFRKDMDTGKRGKLARRLGLSRRSM